MIIQPGYDEVKDKEIIINKTEGTLIHLQQYKYSASALSQYINCSLKFYFNRVAGLRKDKTAEEAFSGASFGSLVHEIMRKLYAGHINKVISAEDIKAVKTELDGNFDEAWENACSRIDELREFAKEISGKNLLFKNVIKKLVGLILNNDIEQAPFKMLDVEGRFETFFQVKSHNITVTGRLDRVEEKNGVIRIIDYKTGKFKMRDQKEESTGEYYDKVFSDPAYKESFQQYYYAMIYNRQNPGTKINIGIYPIKSISGGVDFYENQWIEKEKLDEFSAKLEKLFAEILDPAVPFRKTPDINRCKFCDFTSICYRER
jgi:CRISPR/Cas system-associated exonuclease Cas4 (RecB family)